MHAYGTESFFNIVDFHTAWKIDLIMKKSRPFSDTEFSRRRTAKLGAYDVRIATAEDILIAKLEWAKLSESDRQLEDAAGILRVQGEDLDTRYVELWVEQLGLQSELARARAKVD